jgi:hypothetical protein
MPAPMMGAGAAAAGFVGGALFAVPTLFGLLPAGPLVAGAVAIAIVAGGAAFGGFLGALLHARVMPSLGVAAISAGGAILGASAGAALGALAMSADSSTGFLIAIGGSALGGLAGAAAGGALGVWLVSPSEAQSDDTAPETTAPDVPAPATSQHALDEAHGNVRS